MKTIVLATDGSPSAQKALGSAIDLASRTGWPLHVVTAWTIPVSGFGYGSIPLAEVAESERIRAKLALEGAVEAAQAVGLHPTFALRRGYAVEEICAAAEERDAAMIVIGAHGWGRLKRLFFGSVSSGVLQHARCPVLVVRDSSAAEQDTRQVA
jgi:nucleotide-binding universal stress UspA family protein